MKLLLVECLSPRVASLLIDSGHDVAAAPSVLLIRRADHGPHAIAAVVEDVIASSSDALLNGVLALD